MYRLSERSEAAPRRRRNVTAPQCHGAEEAPHYEGERVTEVKVEITASVWQVRTEIGAVVVEGDELIILESMKMEIPVVAPSDGVVTEVRVQESSQVQEGDVVAVLDP